jgi:mono/diheme cytochrome c family protein
VLAALGWAGLTARAVATTPPSTESPDAGLAQIEPWQEIPADELAAIGYFRKDNCGNCHVIGKSGTGPDLAVAPSQRPSDWLISHFKQPAPNAPSAQLNGAQLKALATFVTKRSAKAVEAWAGAPQQAAEGAMVYQASHCDMCHQLNGVGQKTGPPLNGLADHRARDWVEGHFGDPQKFSPGSAMPPYKFNSHDMDRIASYLLEIPK